jgi:hypothetical protein
MRINNVAGIIRQTMSSNLMYIFQFFVIFIANILWFLSAYLRTKK